MRGASLAGRITLIASLLLASAAWAEPAPEFRLPSRDGRVALSDLRGKLVLIEFWASWCSSCAESMEWLTSLKRVHSGKRFEILAINLDRERENALRAAPADPDFTILFDPAGETPKMYQLDAIPGAVLVSPEGEILDSADTSSATERSRLESSLLAKLNS